MKKRIKGNEIIIFMGEDHASTTAVACSLSGDIEIDSDIIEVSSPDSSIWRDFIAGRKSWKMSLSKLLEIENIYDGNMVGRKVTMQFGFSITDKEGTNPEDRRTFHYLEGTALITSWICTSKNGDYAMGSFEFQGCGKLAPIDTPNFILDESLMDDRDFELE